ncbi:MAG: hypothetical protein V4478_04175 [Patescibacteria group bacterium]
MKKFLFLSIIAVFSAATTTFAQNDAIPVAHNVLNGKAVGEEFIPSSFTVPVNTMDTLGVIGDYRIDPATGKLIGTVIYKNVANQWVKKINGIASPSYIIVRSSDDRRIRLVFKRTGSQWIRIGSISRDQNIAELMKHDGTLTMPSSDPVMNRTGGNFITTL